MSEVIYKSRTFRNVYKDSYLWLSMNKIAKTLYFDKQEVKKWEEFCEDNFKTKRVLSKVLSEAMEEYMQNF